MVNINIDQLATEIAKGLQCYTQDVIRGINVRAEEIAKKGVLKLKQSSPKDKGDYAKSWAVKTERSTGQNNRYIIHNGKHYRLTHLLEFGHAKVGGGRVEANPHIGDVEKEVVEEFIREVEEVIRSGSS